MEENLQTETSNTPPQTVQKMQTNSFAIPVAIVFGFALIAAAIFFSGHASTLTQNKAADGTNADTATDSAPKGPIRPIDEKDHIRGNPNAPIVILEYSDYDCPFCKAFHETMVKVMNAYGPGGKVAWVYRHFPLQQLHPNAPALAQASECIYELGGNDAFWKFTDLVFNERATNEETDMSRLPEFATTSGVSATAFSACMDDGHTKANVDADFADGINAGAKGTPYSLILFGGQEGVINGAQPYEYVQSILDTIIKQLDGKTAASK